VSWNDWIRTLEIEPSIYAADFSRLGEQVEALLRADCRVFHWDVGDAHFIPPVTMGPIVLQWVAPIVHRAGGVLDCHLMVDSPERHIPQFAEAGADSVTVHFETALDLPRVASLAREHGAGVDLALCMTVHPGYSGQAFIEGSFERVRALRSLLPESVHVQVDGGVGAANIRELHEAGATLFVAGASVFGADDPPGAYRQVVQAST
jgi:ribulose-phosphate 3-epimerase